jgi:hypothetical protein
MDGEKTPWLPVWAQRLQWLSYVSFIPLAAFVFMGIWERSYLAVGAFAFFAFPISARTYFKAHAVARGEITWFSEQARDLN